MDSTLIEPPRGGLLHITELMAGGPARAPVTTALLAANLLVFAAMLVQGAGLWHSPNDVQLAWGAGFGPATQDGEWWRLVSAMFLHFGVLHLAVNLWALWDGGRLVERLYGHWRFATVYCAGGIAGNLTSLIVHGDHAISGGASGAIFSVFGALLVFLWRARRNIHPTDFRWVFGGAMAFSVATIALGLMISGIDNAAHVGGLASGALLGTALARAGGGERERWLARGAFGLMVIILIASIPEPGYRWREELQARSEIRAFLQEDTRIVNQWRRILDTGRSEAASFEQLADRIDETVTSEYRGSFEQLSSITIDPAAPSAPALETLRRYAQLREEASRALAEALRNRDEQGVRDALEMARRAPYDARGRDAPAPPTPPSPGPEMSPSGPR